MVVFIAEMTKVRNNSNYGQNRLDGVPASNAVKEALSMTESSLGTY